MEEMQEYREFSPRPTMPLKSRNDLEWSYDDSCPNKTGGRTYTVSTLGRMISPVVLHADGVLQRRQNVFVVTAAQEAKLCWVNDGDGCKVVLNVHAVAAATIAVTF